MSVVWFSPRKTSRRSFATGENLERFPAEAQFAVKNVMIVENRSYIASISQKMIKERCR